MKRLISLLLAFAALLSLCVPAFAAEGSTEGTAAPETEQAAPAGDDQAYAGAENAETKAAGPAAPVIIGAVNTVNGVQVSWNAVPGAVKYRVYYKTDGGWNKAGDTSDTTYIWSGASSGTKYTFTVKACDAAGTPSAYDMTGVSLLCLAAPVISEAVDTADGIRVSWNAVPGVSAYRLYYRTNGDWVGIVKTDATSYTWTGAESGTEYTFTVKGYDASGAAGPYDRAGRTVARQPEPADGVQASQEGTQDTRDASAAIAAPKIEKLENVSNGVRVSWSAVSGAVRYRLYYKDGGKWVGIANTDGTEYVWNGAKNGTAYTFTVKGYGASGTAGAYDKEGWTTTYLSAPVISSAANSADGVKIKWGAVPGVVKYRVYYRTTGGWKKLGDTSSTSYTWTGAKNGTEYAFTVKGCDASGTASAYDETGVGLVYIASPVITEAANTADGIRVSW